MIAVASNFTAAANSLVSRFEDESGHEITLVFGSSGRFYAQIMNGAPFDAFLSADSEKPAALVSSQLALGDSLFTYALGSLVLWSSDSELISNSANVLSSERVTRIAIANERLAPYGRAAEEVLLNLDLLTSLQSKLVRGENIAQTYQFVATENAQAGFVAKSQVKLQDQFIEGSGWEIPNSLHSPIRQDAVLLTRAKDNIAAIDFLNFVKSEPGQAVIQSFGYEAGS